MFCISKQIFCFQILFANNYLHANVFETKNVGRVLFGENPNNVIFVEKKHRNDIQFLSPLQKVIFKKVVHNPYSGERR